MGFFDRLRVAASRAASQAAEGAEKLAKQVAASKSGFLAESAAEMLAEREYRRARALADDGVTPGNAPQIIEILTPYATTDCGHNVLIAYLLAQAHDALDQDGEAWDCYQRAVDLMHDVLQRRDAEPLILEDQGILGDEFEARLLVSLAALALAAEDWNGCIRRCREAITIDSHAHTAIYLQGTAMLRRGQSPDDVAELFAKALTEVEGPTIMAWVEELLPEQRDWFARLTG
ncbi:MAG: hypothetical protein HZB16_21625 [Armatimonadetes bacterium]|nr:hypothetical protein [Armatimonadota bacterium]